MFPSGLESKAIRCPSGDQRGVPATRARPGKQFHGVGAVRIADPDAMDSAAVGFKGDPLAVGRVLLQSDRTRVEAMNRVGGPSATPGPDSERRHMLGSDHPPLVRQPVAAPGDGWRRKPLHY